MKNSIIQLNEKKYKVMSLTEEKIIFSSKDHKSIETLTAATEKSGLLESILVIDLNQVTEVSYNEKEDNFKLSYIKKNKEKNQSFELQDASIRAFLIPAIAEKTILQKQKKKKTNSKLWVVASF